MNRFVQQERLASLGVLIGLFAVLAVAISMVLFVLDLRRVATEAVASEEQLRSIIVSRCEARTAYDTRLVTSAEDDAEFYSELLRISNNVVIPEGTPADQIESLEKQRTALQSALEKKRAIAAQGVIGNCTDYAR